MATVVLSFLVFSFLLSLFGLEEARSAATGTSKALTEVITADPRLKKAKQWAEESGILNDIDFNLYGGKITLVLPSNEAFEEFERDHPTWTAKLVADSADIETLLLFASTDHRISVEDVKKGAYEDPDSIISILSEYSSISKEGKLCVTGYTRTTSCSDPDSMPCCANVDLNEPILAHNGNIYIVDKVLLPQDLIDRLQE